MAALALLGLSESAAICPVCGSPHCKPSPTFMHQHNYPFLPGGADPMASQRHVIAPHRIIDNERVVYGTGDRVPWDDAVKYGLVAPAKAPVKKTRSRRPTEDRARKPSEDR